MELRHRILIVDDDHDMVMTLTLILGEEGYEAIQAFNGQEAIKTVREEKIDLILMDIKMPGLNGVETYKEIRKIRPGVPVVMMTAYAVENLVREALEHSAREVIYKPFDTEDMLELINKLKEGTIISIIDDDPVSSAKMRDYLEEKGYRVDITTNGTDAVELIRKRKPHIVFIDIEIPPANGLDTYLKIKEISPKITAVMLAEYRKNTKSLAGEAIRENAFTCLYRPFEIDEIMQVIEKIDKIKKKNLKN
ncbi:MAG TPA: hypothetical protein DHV62_10595 [Elusimicrobia bacterium]|jgi:DNA-binding NtrC family response regulator|nr:hypothetical protein [Elusimicrobiota bacterium]